MQQAKRNASSGGRTLTELLTESGYEVPAEADGVLIHRISADSRDVRPGDLFVALQGTQTDGHEFASDALAAGAAAVIVESELAGASLGKPIVCVDDTRTALARIAAVWHGNPADQLPLIGITGTLGKTTVLTMLEAILLRSGRRVGTIGSLGVRLDGEANMTGYTAPDPLILHEALAQLVESGAELCAMEVTTHALTQERVHGLRYGLGVFTNLVPLEHVDYHGSFRRYVEAKTRFFDHLPSGVPLIYSYDDRAVRGVAGGLDVKAVGVGQGAGAHVGYEMQETSVRGSAFTLRSRVPLPALKGREISPFEIQIELQTLGRSMVVNAAIAATTAIVAGADPRAVQQALAEFPPPRRRLQVLREEPFLVLDDTAGHPESIGMVFDVIDRLQRSRVHIVFAIRGQRGARINRRTAESLAIWTTKSPLATLIITSSEGAADELNGVTAEEREAFLSELMEEDVEFEECPRLDEAIRRVVERAGPGDLVLLLGAQGMDDGAALLEDALAS